MGQVYAAQHTLLPRRAAVKVLRAELCGCALAFEGLLQESRLLESFTDPSVAKVYDAGVLDGARPWFAMELIEGACLAELVELSATLSIDRIARLVCAIAEALGHAHRRGIVHGDVKPDNIMVIDDAQGLRVKLVDWSIARAMKSCQAAQTTSGTPRYMAPEQIRGDALDDRTDVYGLGVLTYELLTRHVPFTSTKRDGLFLAHLYTVPRAPSVERRDLPAPLDALVLAMLAKTSQARPSLERVREVMRAAFTEELALSSGAAAPALVTHDASSEDRATQQQPMSWTTHANMSTVLLRKLSMRARTDLVARPRRRGTGRVRRKPGARTSLERFAARPKNL